MGLSVPALQHQITGHLKHPGFALVVAYAGGSTVGFGYAIPCDATYWSGDLVDQVPDGARTERLTPRGGFRARREGVAHASHDVLRLVWVYRRISMIVGMSTPSSFRIVPAVGRLPVVPATLVSISISQTAARSVQAHPAPVP